MNGERLALLTKMFEALEVESDESDTEKTEGKTGKPSSPRKDLPYRSVQTFRLSYVIDWHTTHAEFPYKGMGRARMAQILDRINIGYTRSYEQLIDLRTYPRFGSQRDPIVFTDYKVVEFRPFEDERRKGWFNYKEPNLLLSLRDQVNTGSRLVFFKPDQYDKYLATGEVPIVPSYSIQFNSNTP